MKLCNGSAGMCNQIFFIYLNEKAFGMEGVPKGGHCDRIKINTLFPLLKDDYAYNCLDKRKIYGERKSQ